MTRTRLALKLVLLAASVGLLVDAIVISVGWGLWLTAGIETGLCACLVLLGVALILRRE